MTETTYAPPPPPPPPAPRLERDPDDQVLAGVCAAFARHTDTDPVLWRVTIAVLALFGGAGLVLYALGWALVPRTGEAQSAAERVLGGSGGSGDRSTTATGVVLAVGGVVLLLAVLDDGPAFGALLVLGAIAYLVLRERRDPQPVPSFGPPVTQDATTSTPTSTPMTTPFEVPPYSAPPPGSSPVPRPPRRPRSPLGALTLSIALIVTGALLALRLAGVDALTAPRVLAVALLVVGSGLLVGAWLGRARWLIPVGLLLALALALSTAARAAELGDGVGEQTWVAVPGGSYSLGAGEAVLDLRQLDPGRRTSVEASVGLGRLTVLVPDDLEVRVDAEAGVGDVSEVQVDGRRTVHSREDADVHDVFTSGDRAGAAAVRLDLEVGAGEIEVRRVAA